jgi:hypothetical protein
MMKRILLGVAALAIVSGVGLATKANAQTQRPPLPFPVFSAPVLPDIEVFQGGSVGPSGDPVQPIALFENTSVGTPFFAKIAETGNKFTALNPSVGPALFANAQRLGQGLVIAGFNRFPSVEDRPAQRRLGRGLVNAGFNPTSPARRPFAPQ